jgi:folate-binding protein YgfZ
MAQTLQNLQQAQGATLSPEGIPLTFGNDPIALGAAATGWVVCDRSHWGLIELSGADRLRFLHNQTTNAFNGRQPGEGCDTVFVTSTARTLDLTTVYVTDEALLILTSPGQDQRLLDWMDRYIFPADQVSLRNLTDTTVCFSLVGPASEQILQTAGIAPPSHTAYGHHRVIDLEGLAVRVAVGSGLGLPGYTLVLPRQGSDRLWQRLTEAGAIAAGEQVWQQLRVQAGRPIPGAELTEDYNPLEAGLWETISFDKGCYIGQETIARLNTYQGVKQQLWGIQLEGEATPGTAIAVDDAKVGVLTSVVDTPQGPLGLGYIRTKAGGAGLRVTVGNVLGTVVDLPFASRGYLAEGLPPKHP